MKLILRGTQGKTEFERESGGRELRGDSCEAIRTGALGGVGRPAPSARGDPRRAR
jgi:hypothetical protein